MTAQLRPAAANSPQLKQRKKKAVRGRDRHEMRRSDGKQQRPWTRPGGCKRKESNKNMKGNRERQEEGCIKREAKLMG